MKRRKPETRGFTLIASLLMLLLLSGIAIGLMMMVNTETRVGSTDLQNNMAFHAADGAMEKMASDLSATFQNAQAPTSAQICNLSGPPLGSASNEPSMIGVNWTQYQVIPGNLYSSTCPTQAQFLAMETNGWGQISAGPNQGLWAQIIPINMIATASLFGNQEVSMTRTAQVALIPVFQFGVFCEGDCGFFDSPNLTFAGRVHTNADLYLGVAGCCNLVFNNKIEAYGNVITSVLPNGLSSSSFNDTGNVYIPTQPNGCLPNTSSHCYLKTTNGDGTYGDGSVQGGGSSTPQTTATYNASNWNPFSTSTSQTNHMIINGNYYNDVSPEPGNVPQGTGAKKLSMPFVNGTTFPYEIIRRATGSDGIALSQSREYNLAQIHVLLSDDPAELPGGSGDSNNIRLANVTADSSGNGASNPYGIATVTGTTSGTGTLGTPPSGTSYTTYFATATNAIPSGTCTGTYNPGGANPNVGINCLPDWPYPPAPWTPAYMTAVAAGTDSSGCILLCPSNQSNAWSLTNLTGKIGAPFISGSINTAQGGMTGGPSLYSANYLGSFQVTSPNVQTYSNIPTFLPCPASNITPANKPGNCPLTTPTTPFFLVNSPPSPSVGNSTFYNAAAIATSPTVATATWNLIDGWLRVEYKDASGNWHPVTLEWLQLGFARDVAAPTAANPNPINPHAILLLQEPADRFTQLTSPVTGAAFSYPTSAIHTLTNPGFITSNSTIPAGCASVSGGACTFWYVTPPQVLVDSNTSSWLFGNASSTFPSSAATSALGLQSPTRFNWYPINFYDAREGEPRDVIWSGTYANDNSCTSNGVMNAVEIDVGNLKKWLAGSIGTSGNQVDAVQQNGYVLYFSDRRGMLPNKYKWSTTFTKSGDSGLEDVVNAASATGNPDGVLEPVPPGKNLSPEDVNQDGLLDNFGAQNMGLGFYGTVATPVGEPVTTNCTNANMPCQKAGTGVTTNNLAPGLNLWYQITSNDTDLASPDPYGTPGYTSRINSCSTARKNWVSGARHVLKLVDGAFGQVPTNPAGTTADPGGFTVASENPVYIQGDYNSNSSDAFWGGGADASGHAASAVIADAVMVLSDNWVDQYSTMGNPANGGNASPTLAQNNRPAVTTYYRVAVAGGKNLAFPFPSWETATDYGFGTDGGIHNFLRFLEDWQTTGSTLNYGGSLVSLYYATYNTGLFKCCAYSVYQPPVRNYIFDNDFTTPSGLPPGTPMFRDVETLSYRQLFATRTNTQ